MYTLEVEIALDIGRPISIRNCDIDVEWPIQIDDDVLFPSASIINATENSHRSEPHGYAS
jgi:hypothetical protein